MVHEVMCAFCGEGVPTVGLDPCALIVVTKWREPAAQQEQQFFAHATCVLGAFHPEVAATAERLQPQ